MFKHILFISAIMLVIVIAATTSDKEIKDDWKKYYSNYKGDACFILYDMNNDKYLIYNNARAEKSFIPASTFKIFNSLAALDAGAVKDENEIIKWDGIDKGREAWNKDHNMRSAFKVSAVWFYQELAHRIGSSKMKNFIEAANYGNKDIRGELDIFWLRGKLRITPMQQIDLLKRLYNNDLPFSQRAMDIVKDIMIYEKTDDYVLRAKTGWADGETGLGWFVGYIETKGNVYFFVNNMDIVNDGDENGRIEVTKNILMEMRMINYN